MKDYTFTLAEVLALRDACIEYGQILKPAPNQIRGVSEGRKEMIRRLAALADQFKQDALLMKEGA